MKSTKTVPATFAAPETSGLKHLRGLPNVIVLGLSGTRVTDAGMADVAGLTGLHRLYQDRTSVTDEGLAHSSRLYGSY